MRPVTGWLVALTVAAACSGSTGRGNTSSTQASSSSGDTNGSTVTTSVASAVHAPDALVPDGTTSIQRVVVGTSVDTNGVVVGVSSSFATTNQDLVAGALLLADAPSGPATVTWSVETPDGERTLFVDQATAKPSSILLARAKGSGHVPEGIYRVRVAVGSEVRDALFAVSDFGTVRPAAKSTLIYQQPEGTSDSWESGGTQTEAPEACKDDHTLAICWGWFDDEETPSTTAPPCDADEKPDLSISQEVATLGGEATIKADTRYCDPAGGLSVEAGVAGASPAAIGQGGPDVSWSGNTCRLAGASDLFADVVQANAVVANSSRRASTAIALGEFGPLPLLPSASPAPGTVVTDGQTISLVAFAIVFGATRGIKVLDVTAPDGTVVIHAGRAQPAAACEFTLERFEAYGSGQYVVPNDNKPVVELSIRAETFDGSTSQYPLRWAKKPTWSGSLTMALDQPVPTGHQYQDYTADVVVSETSTNNLTGTMNGQYTQTLTMPTCPSDTTNPGTAAGDLSGTIDSTGMHLTVTPGANASPTVTPCPGAGTPGVMGSPLEFAPLAQLLANLAPQGNGRYAGHVDVTVPGPGPFEIRASLTLTPLDQDPVSNASMSISPAVPPAP